MAWLKRLREKFFNKKEARPVANGTHLVRTAGGHVFLWLSTFRDGRITVEEQTDIR